MGRIESKSNTRHWEGSLCVSEEGMSLLFILSHLSSASLREIQLMCQTTDFIGIKHILRTRMPSLPCFVRRAI